MDTLNIPRRLSAMPGQVERRTLNIEFMQRPMTGLKILQLAHLRYLLFKNLKIKNLNRSTQR
jgi:hypothetical protein